MIPLMADFVMIGTASVSGSYCIAARQSTSVTAKVLAVLMPVVMLAATLGDHSVASGAGAAALIVLSLVLLRSSTSVLNLHRGLGGLLMAALLVGHIHLMSIMDGAPDHHHDEGMTGIGGMATPHGFGTHAIVVSLVLVSAAFLIWTMSMTSRHRTAPESTLTLVEVSSMAVSVAVMSLGLVLMVHGMHG